MHSNHDLKILTSQLFIIIMITVLCASTYNMFAPKGIWAINTFEEDQLLVEGEITIENAFDYWQHGALFIDVRPDFLYAEKHVKNAVSIPFALFQDSLSARTPLFQRANTIVVYCSHEECNSSEIIHKKIKKAGFQHVFFFKGGIREWQNQGLPTSSVN